MLNLNKYFSLVQEYVILFLIGVHRNLLLKCIIEPCVIASLPRRLVIPSGMCGPSSFCMARRSIPILLKMCSQCLYH